jgi:hypothetical protein
MPRWPGSLAGVDRLRELLWRWSEGQDGSGCNDGEEFRRRSSSPEKVSSENSVDAEA